MLLFVICVCVYFQNEMRLATLPPGYSYEENLGMKLIELDCVPYFVQYHVESKVSLFFVNINVPCLCGNYNFLLLNFSWTVT